MSIRLEAVTSSNYEAVCDLDATDEQQEYVASNMWSLVESHYCQGHTCRAIYQNDTPVVFLCGYLKRLKKFLSGVLWWINAINNLVLAELH